LVDAGRGVDRLIGRLEDGAAGTDRPLMRQGSPHALPNAPERFENMYLDRCGLRLKIIRSGVSALTSALTT
jgi:hypothetical protein